MEKTLILLAAGIGRRYGGLKQLEPVGPHGESILEYSISDARRAGFGQTVLVIRPETEREFRASIGTRVPAELPLVYAFQTLDDLPANHRPPANRTRPWGTGQALLSAEPYVDGPFAVINADDFYGASAYLELAAFLGRATSGDGALAGFSLSQTLSAAGPVSRAVCRISEDGLLGDIVEILEIHERGGGGVYRDEQGEEHVLPGETPVSMNMWAFTPALFPELRRRFELFLDRPENLDRAEFLIPDVVRGLVAAGARIEVLRHQGSWCGITFPEDRAGVVETIARHIRRGAYPARLWDNPAGPKTPQALCSPPGDTP